MRLSCHCFLKFSLCLVEVSLRSCSGSVMASEEPWIFQPEGHFNTLPTDKKLAHNLFMQKECTYLKIRYPFLSDAQIRKKATEKWREVAADSFPNTYSRKKSATNTQGSVHQLHSSFVPLDVGHPAENSSNAEMSKRHTKSRKSSKRVSFKSPKEIVNGKPKEEYNSANKNKAQTINPKYKNTSHCSSKAQNKSLTKETYESKAGACSWSYKTAKFVEIQAVGKNTYPRSFQAVICEERNVTDGDQTNMRSELSFETSSDIPISPTPQNKTYSFRNETVVKNETPHHKSAIVSTKDDNAISKISDAFNETVSFQDSEECIYEKQEGMKHTTVSDEDGKPNEMCHVPKQSKERKTKGKQNRKANKAVPKAKYERDNVKSDAESDESHFVFLTRKSIRNEIPNPQHADSSSGDNFCNSPVQDYVDDNADIGTVMNNSSFDSLLSNKNDTTKEESEKREKLYEVLATNLRHYEVLAKNLRPGKTNCDIGTNNKKQNLINNVKEHKSYLDSSNILQAERKISNEKQHVKVTLVDSNGENPKLNLTLSSVDLSFSDLESPHIIKNETTKNLVPHENEEKRLKNAKENKSQVTRGTNNRKKLCLKSGSHSRKSTIASQILPEDDHISLKTSSNKNKETELSKLRETSDENRKESRSEARNEKNFKPGENDTTSELTTPNPNESHPREKQTFCGLTNDYSTDSESRFNLRPRVPQIVWSSPSSVIKHMSATKEKKKPAARKTQNSLKMESSTTNINTKKKHVSLKSNTISAKSLKGHQNTCSNLSASLHNSNDMHPNCSFIDLTNSSEDSDYSPSSSFLQGCANYYKKMYNTRNIRKQMPSVNSNRQIWNETKAKSHPKKRQRESQKSRVDRNKSENVSDLGFKLFSSFGSISGIQNSKGAEDLALVPYTENNNSKFVEKIIMSMRKHIQPFLPEQKISQKNNARSKYETDNEGMFKCPAVQKAYAFTKSESTAFGTAEEKTVIHLQAGEKGNIIHHFTTSAVTVTPSLTKSSSVSKQEHRYEDEKPLSEHLKKKSFSIPSEIKDIHISSPPSFSSDANDEKPRSFHAKMLDSVVNNLKPIKNKMQPVGEKGSQKNAIKKKNTSFLENQFSVEKKWEELMSLVSETNATQDEERENELDSDGNSLISFPMIDLFDDKQQTASTNAEAVTRFDEGNSLSTTKKVSSLRSANFMDRFQDKKKKDNVKLKAKNKYQDNSKKTPANARKSSTKARSSEKKSAVEKVTVQKTQKCHDKKIAGKNFQSSCSYENVMKRYDSLIQEISSSDSSLLTDYIDYSNVMEEVKLKRGKQKGSIKHESKENRLTCESGDMLEDYHVNLSTSKMLSVAEPIELTYDEPDTSFTSVKNIYADNIFDSPYPGTQVGVAVNPVEPEEKEWPLNESHKNMFQKETSKKRKIPYEMEDNLKNKKRAGYSIKEDEIIAEIDQDIKAKSPLKESQKLNYSLNFATGLFSSDVNKSDLKTSAVSNNVCESSTQTSLKKVMDTTKLRSKKMHEAHSNKQRIDDDDDDSNVSSYFMENFPHWRSRKDKQSQAATQSKGAAKEKTQNEPEKHESNPRDSVDMTSASPLRPYSNKNQASPLSTIGKNYDDIKMLLLAKNDEDLLSFSSSDEENKKNIEDNMQKKEHPNPGSGILCGLFDLPVESLEKQDQLQHQQ